MERKFISIIGLLTIITFVSFMHQGCGYFEHDGTEYLKEVTGKIKIFKQENNKNEHLIFVETEESNAVIVNDCVNVYFDSTNNKIYAESKLTETKRNYYEIKIINLNSMFISEAVKKEKISMQIFNLKTKGLIKI